ncbi:hypothetical protein SAMN02745248_02372 [Hathewaya proteolytica DSM 3090]|uniref:Uncharacterized protein n=1 Tax=Hathewaya proteolytica DSM 3090 TaxID=1121331 RepID=A0A1M6RUI1_9CLOT|nr:hypothetical protein [Hathewaya proteolytica]SHK36050.1 hypothetical protein SAMN02745248_02372 [Hathewaya proteolytica DSM 3090]
MTKNKNSNILEENNENLEEEQSCAIVYDIKKSYVFKDAIMQFYENWVQIFVGPAICGLGYILRTFTKLDFFGSLLIGFGAFYILFPYIMLLANLTTVKKQRIEMRVGKKGINISNLLTSNASMTMLSYDEIYDLEREKRYLRILPCDNNGKVLNPLSIPVNHVVEGNLEEFTQKINECVKKAKGKNKNSAENTFNGKLVMEYNLTEDQFKKIYIREYFKKKIHIFYIIAFAGIAAASFFVNISLAITALVLAVFYIVFPRWGYKLHVKDHTGRIVVRDCMNGYITIEGNNIKVKTKAEKIKIIYNGEYIKYFIPVKKKYFRYIKSNACDKTQLKRFMGLVNKG